MQRGLRNRPHMAVPVLVLMHLLQLLVPSLGAYTPKISANINDWVYYVPGPYNNETSKVPHAELAMRFWTRQVLQPDVARGLQAGRSTLVGIVHFLLLARSYAGRTTLQLVQAPGTQPWSIRSNVTQNTLGR